MLTTTLRGLPKSTRRDRKVDVRGDGDAFVNVSYEDWIGLYTISGYNVVQDINVKKHTKEQACLSIRFISSSALPSFAAS